MADTDDSTNPGPIEEDPRLDERAVAGQLALELMHEIRNPLDALGNLTFLTLEGAENPDLVRKYMHLAEEQIATLNGLAWQTLQLARSSGTRKVAKLYALIESALRAHQGPIQAKQIHLVKELAVDLSAEVHAGQIVQVLSNLIANAIDAMSTNGTLEIYLRPEANGFRIIIADDGCGIPPHAAEDVFKPFYTTKKETGTGLGLHISKRIIEAHHGTLTMRSGVGSGQSGTTFTIFLPMSIAG